MNTTKVVDEVQKALKAKAMKSVLGAVFGKNDPNTKPDENEIEKMIQEGMQITVKVQAVTMFYEELVHTKDPAYYGKKVRPGEGDKVLMRWKIDNDNYRVIFGDLTTENVPTEQLGDLE